MKRALSAALLAMTVCWSSCIFVVAAIVGAAVAVGAYKYINNQLERDYEATLEQCHEGTRRAVKGLGLFSGTYSLDFQKGFVETRMSDGRVVKIALEKATEKTTRVRIRVGDFESDANRSAAQRIHEQIYKELTGKGEK